MMSPVPLIELTRGDTVESIHSGCVAVVDVNGKLQYYAGDPSFMTFTRSALKPFQAMPFVKDKGPDYFHFGLRELALMCASHSGEPVHVAIAQSILQAAGCDEHALQCGCHLPIYYSATGKEPPCGQVYTQLHHNCSGKHAGFLAYCRQHGLSLENYLDSEHPLQQAVKTSVAHFSGLSPDALKSGIDGCSAPNYAMPLSSLALSYARLSYARLSHLASEPAHSTDPADYIYGKAARILYEAMTAHPELVSGTGRNDLALMQAGRGDWVAKAGAEGVQAIGIRSAGLGIAIKIADGNSRGLLVATLSVLSQLGLSDKLEGASLISGMHPVQRNYRGRTVGEMHAVFKLERA